MPIFFLTILPQWSIPSFKSIPALYSAIATVKFALTAQPSAMPLSPFNPLGISAEITYAPDAFIF